MAKQQLSSNDQKVLKKVGKRPQTAAQIAAKAGFNSHHGVARPLSNLVKAGEVVRTDKGYQKA